MTIQGLIWAKTYFCLGGGGGGEGGRGMPSVWIRAVWILHTALVGVG